MTVSWILIIRCLSIIYATVCLVSVVLLYYFLSGVFLHIFVLVENIYHALYILLLGLVVVSYSDVEDCL
jgi:hypothetical protein